jgi:hypothetical protein
MSNKFSAIALGTLLGISAVAFSGASASAAAMFPLPPLASGEANAASGGIFQVDSMKNHNNWNNNNWNNNNWNNKKWNNKKWNKRYGKRCNYYNDNCRHYYRGGYYETPWWTLPLIVGGGIAANNDYDDGYYDDDYDDGGGLSSRHVRYCLNKYRSYNPRNNTWVAYSGRVHQCQSPYL